jgi:hypothetical protein
MRYAVYRYFGKKPMRRALLLLTTLVLLAGCAATRPGYDPGRNWTYVCFPGSAIKRKAPPGSVYPDWMTRERGSCLH